MMPDLALLLMDPLKAHYRALLGLDESWMVTAVELKVLEMRGSSAFDFGGHVFRCPACAADC